MDRITEDLHRRLEELRPLVQEAERLEAALEALGPAPTRSAAPRSTPARRRGRARARGNGAQAAPAAAEAPAGAPAAEAPAEEPAPTAQPARRQRTQRRRGGGRASSGARPQRAPRGQNRARVLEIVTERPGATAAEIASASGVQRTIVYAVLRRLQSEGEVTSSELPSGTTGWRRGTGERPAAETPAAATTEEQPAAGASEPAGDAGESG
jgi:Sugar-specific transcriptional regulator TrmB